MTKTSNCLIRDQRILKNGIMNKRLNSSNTFNEIWVFQKLTNLVYEELQDPIKDENGAKQTKPKLKRR